jgi:hypothetical protein
MLIRWNPAGSEGPCTANEVLQTGTCRTSADIVWGRARHHIAGQVILHLLSSWCSGTRSGRGVGLAFNETYEAMAAGIQVHCARSPMPSKYNA